VRGLLDDPPQSVPQVPVGVAPRAATHTTAAIPAGLASLFLWLLCLLLQHMTTAGSTPDEIGK